MRTTRDAYEPDDQPRCGSCGKLTEADPCAGRGGHDEGYERCSCEPDDPVAGARLVSSFEAFGRARKVDTLVAELELYCERLGYDPYGDAARIVATLRSWGESGVEWRQLAVSIGKKPPSALTIAAVIDRFESRVDRAEEVA